MNSCWRILCLAAVALAVCLPVAATGCGSDKVDDAVLSIDQALAVNSGRDVKVQGFLIATENEVRLASALLESYPPQAGGAAMPVEDLDLSALAGLSTTADNPELAQTSWSDYPVILEGIMENGALKVKKTPPVVEAITGEARVRFSPASEPLVPGEMVWWVLEVTNLAQAPLDLTFASGQMGEVVLSQNGVEVYRWSSGKQFIQAVTVDTLQPGRSKSIVLNDVFSLAPGTYEAIATVTASIGPEGSGGLLHPVETVITVR